MLRRVTIENYALIDSLEIDFNKGLNIITGETGAGKSLLLGALSIVLGGKCDASIVRNTERPCVIELEFDITGLALEESFKENDIDYADITTIRRVINSSGKSRSYINELPVNITYLKELGESLIDIHSQHQTLLLGSNKFQIELLDSVAKTSVLLESYTTDYNALKSATKRLHELYTAEKESRKDEEYLRFQYSQLEEAALKEGELQELELLLNELTHASDIKEAMLSSETIISGDESGVEIQLKSIEQLLRKTEHVFPKSAELGERIRGVLVEVKDISSELAAEGERIEVDPNRLEKTELRLNTLYALQQKHKVSSIEELITLKQDIEIKLVSMDSYETQIKEIEALIIKLKKSAESLAQKISTARKKGAPEVEKQVVKTTNLLGMPNVQFIAEITPLDELQAHGLDRVRFLFTANKNSAPQPVEQIASGGEMSRLMLSLKALIAQHRQLPTIIFDEIDTGISGEIADKMGEIIYDLSSHLQVINITHLPQVASKGLNHYFVYKEDSGNATNTKIKQLSDAERIKEIAKMLSGAEVTDAATEQAATLIARGRR